MAHDLPFSISNILRPNFPHPSRLSQTSQTPVLRVLYVKPFKEGWQQLTQPCHQQNRSAEAHCLQRRCTCTMCKNDLYLISGHRTGNQSESLSEDPQSEHKVHGSEKSEESTEERRRRTNRERGAGKRKRIRSRFTQRQINFLEDIFSRQMYLTRDERALLSKILYMTQLQIRNWFQNKRYQMRNKKKTGRHV